MLSEVADDLFVLSLQQATAEHGIELKEYDTFGSTLPQILAALQPTDKVMVEKATCSASMLACVPPAQREQVEISPVEHFKAQKNPVSARGFQKTFYDLNALAVLAKQKNSIVTHSM